MILYQRNGEHRVVPSGIIAAYLMVGGLWSCCSEEILIATMQDPILLSEMAAINNLLFVLATAAMLHVLIRLGVDRIQRSEAEVRRREAREHAIQTEAEAAKRSFFRNTILAVTDGKLNLVEYEDVVAMLDPDRRSVNLRGSADVCLARSVAEEVATRCGMSEERASMFLLGVGEAASNAIKHARGGVAHIGIRDGRVQVCIQDHGPGIETDVLPQATLMKGFSTKPSMGMGYTLMLEAAEMLFVATDARGTCVLLEANPFPEAEYMRYRAAAACAGGHALQ